MYRKEIADGKRLLVLMAVLIVCLAIPLTAQVLLVDDPLQGSTSGSFHGGSGQFVSGGWKVTGQTDSIYWRLPYTVSRGAAEFYVKGLNPNECRAGMTNRAELFHMYDWTYGGNADENYSGGYRDCYHKMFIVKHGCDLVPYGLGDTVKTLWQIWPDLDEPYTALSWDSNTNYLFRVEWEPDGTGHSVCRVYRNGQLIRTLAVAGSWDPAGHSVRIAASPRREAESGAPVDAVYSYLKVWDTSAPVPPGTPTVIWPVSGKVSKTTTPRIHWMGDTHSSYQVRVNTSNNPNSGIVWDSGTVVSPLNQAVSGALSNGVTYYVFARLANAYGWSGWSATGHSFTVNTAFDWERRGAVFMSGSAVRDDNGEFCGLGATYMSAMRFCRSDRDRFRQDLALLAAGGFNYIRMITMVGWYDAWRNKEIAPVSFDNEVLHHVDAWPDYWQQFRDCIDIAYDEYGLRSEVTMFADAQMMPIKNDRYNHMQGILDNLAGRIHKVMHFEICNEAFQNGFPGEQGIADLREFGAWMKQRTGRPVALSAPERGYVEDFVDLYSGSAADLATGHFERWTGGPESGWLCVRDPEKVVGVAGIPPCSSNEPVGPGASVGVETDPIKLVSAAVYAWIAKLPMYVYHTGAGVFGIERFENMQALHDYKHLLGILPSDLPNWIKNDGLESSAAFTVFCDGVANQYWTSNYYATSGCHRNIGSWKAGEFVCYPQGILGNGVTLQARQSVTFTVYNPLTGAVVLGPVSKGSGEQITLPQGPGAYIIRGTGTMSPSCPTDEFSYPTGALNGNGGWYGSATAAQIQTADNRVILYGGAGSYDAMKSMYCQAGGSGYIPVTIKVYAGTGGRTIWNVWLDDTNGNNLARWYGTANSARGRIGATADVTAEQTLVYGQWNTLLIRINPSANTSQFFFNGVDIGTLSHSSQGAGDILGRVRIERMDNAEAVGHYLYFDDLSTDPGDTTPPGPVTNFVATGADGQVNLSWTNPGDADFAGTMIRFSTIGYPGSPTGGSQAYNGTGTSTVHTGLTNGVTYYYTAFAYDEVPNYSAPTAVPGTPIGDTTPPGNVTGFSATSTGVGNQLQLSWTNPGDSDLTGIKVMFKTTGYPTGPTDGTQCYNALGTSFLHTGLTDGVTYYYKAFAYDEVPNYASGAQISGVPTDTQAPGVVTGFIATPSAGQNALVWTNPGGDFTGTMIRFKTTGYPTSVTDGTQIYNSNGTSYAHTGLTAGVTYYYSAYAHDEVPNYAGAAQTYGTTPSEFCFQDEFNYPQAVALVGQGGWTGTATNAHIQCTGSFVTVYGGSQAKNATKTMNCSGGPYIWVRLLAYQGIGTSNMWNVWINDSSGKNFARWYGGGTTARGRIGTSSTVTAVRNLSGGGLWDSLVVKIDPAANTSQFFFNGEDLGVYSHGTQPGTAVGQIKIERENNSAAAGDHMYLDNIRVSQS